MSKNMIPTIRIAICDDEIRQTDILVGYLEELKKIYPKIYYDTYSSGDELVKHYERSISEEHYDLIFLDVEMKDSDNGIATAAKLRKFDTEFCIVFVTAHQNYVWDSFIATPLDFLVKPVLFDKFKEVFIRAHEQATSKNKIFTFTNNYQEIRVFIRKIIFFECHHRIITLHTTDGNYRFYGTMKAVFEMLDHELFVIPHKSYIVSMACIQRLEHDKIFLHNHQRAIPISGIRVINMRESFRKFDMRRCAV